jgi:RNA polymerase sigma-70 factor (ECF subfamily)
MTIGDGGEDHDRRFEEIYRKSYGRVYRFFHHDYGIADDEAHDLAQETFHRLYAHMHQYRGEAVWGYLQAVARTVLFNWRRAAMTGKRNAKLVDIDDPAISQQLAAPEGPDYAERQSAAALQKRLVAAIAELSNGQQEVLRLQVRGFKYAEIEKILKISPDAVKSRLRDARKHLRARLRDEPGGLAPGTLPEDER